MHKESRHGAHPAPALVAAPLRKVLDLITGGEAASRADIARRTGLARSTVSQQVDYLIERGIVDEVETSESARGRPPRILTISRRAGIIAVADVDTHETRVAIADLSRKVIDRDVVTMPVDSGPEKVLAEIATRLHGMIAGHREQPAPVRQVVVGLPAPVDFSHGCAVRPPIMPGWDGYPVGAHLEAAFDAPVLVDNDVNLMALGEASLDRAVAPLLCIKVATGIGAGIVTADGDVHRGADGAAGDIGHIRSLRGQDVLCRCGKVGCLEAVASCAAVLRALDIPESPDGELSGVEILAERVASGDAVALHSIRQAAAEIGEVVAMLVHVYNPRTLVLGGSLSEQRDEILSGVRAVVYERALPLATRKLTITMSQLGADAGIEGAVALAAKNIFSPEGLSHLLA